MKGRFIYIYIHTIFMQRLGLRTHTQIYIYIRVIYTYMIYRIYIDMYILYARSEAKSSTYILWNLTATPKSFLLRRDGKEFEVMLPADVKPGEKVNVTLEKVRLIDLKLSQRFGKQKSQQVFRGFDGGLCFFGVRAG